MQRRAMMRMMATVAAGWSVGSNRAWGQALRAKPRQRVIVDNDFSGDPDGLFQLAHHLASPSVEIPFVIGSHIHAGDFLDGTTTQADNAAREARALMATMRLPHPPEVVAGRNEAPARGARPVATPAVRRIVAEAMRSDTRLPLFYAAGAGLTELAEAVRIEPAIGSRIRLLWIGGPEHDDLRPTIPPRTDREYNLTIDLAAAQTVFNDSAIEIWQVPRDAYRTLIVSHAELVEGLRGTGALGRFLLDRLGRVTRKIDGLGETYILGDSPLVTLSALQSSFEPDAASSRHVVRPTPRIDDRAGYVQMTGTRPMRVYTAIDTRLTFADMFAKFRATGR